MNPPSTSFNSESALLRHKPAVSLLHDGFFDIRFSVVSDFRFHLALGDSGSLLFQAADFRFEFRVAFLQLLDCAFELLQSIRF